MDASEIIEKLGGTEKTAELCQVSASAVSQWKASGIPKSRMMYLRLARPDVFGDVQTRNRRRTDKRVP